MLPQTNSTLVLFDIDGTLLWPNGAGSLAMQRALVEVYGSAGALDQELTATVEIVCLRLEKQLVNLRTLCYNPLGETVCRGEALVLVSDVEGP